MEEDKLMQVQIRARQLTVLDLKKQALAAKERGSVEEALQLLRQAKTIEKEEGKEENDDDEEDDDDEPPFSSTLPLFWKKVAVLCKQAGDLERAKQALMHSKELESAGVATEAEAESQTATQSDEFPEPPSAPEPQRQGQGQRQRQGQPQTQMQTQTQTQMPASTVNSDIPPPLYDDIGSFDPPPPPSYDHVVTNDNEEDDEPVDEEEALMLAELMGGGERSRNGNATTAAAPAVVDASASAGPAFDGNDGDGESSLEHKAETAATNAMTFTDEELMDEEMMTEFRLGEVEGIPTQEEYAAKILAYKKLALRCKQEGDIPKATQNLRAAKQLEKVALALKAMDDGPGPSEVDSNGGWMATLNPEESDLLGELFEPSSSSSASSNRGAEIKTETENGIASGGEATNKDRLTAEDLEDMEDDNDVIELVEMMGPDALPTVEELTETITQHKQEALRYKQEGNIEMAKSSLLQSKKVKLQAMRLAGIYRKLETRNATGGADDDGGETDQHVSMEALEALVNGADTPKKDLPPKPAPPSPPKDPWLSKPSSEIKAEVIRLKNEKQVKEATRLLQLFKQKLAQEQHQVELERRSKLTDTIQKRVEMAEIQRRSWQYYHWFGTESAVGRDQYQEWTNFEKDCRRAIHLIQSEGSGSVQLAPRVQDPTNTNTNTNTNTDSASENKTTVVAKKLYMLDDDIPSLVETCTNASPSAAPDAADGDATDPPNHLANNALEVAVMGLFDMEQNEKLQKILSKQPKGKKASCEYGCPDLRINAKLQLPIHPDDASKPVFMDFDPTEISVARQRAPAETNTSTSTSTTIPAAKAPALRFRYDFDPSSKSCRQQIGLPRKDPKHERILLRRMETKTIQLSVYYLHNQKQRQEAAARKKAAAEAKSKSWGFFGFKGSEPKSQKDEAGEGDSKDVFLGKVTIDFKQLLARGCIAGDFPIMVNSKEIGGVLRVCLRTRPVLDPDRYEGVPLLTEDGNAPSPSIKTYKKGLAFVFKNKDGDETTSIEAIKRESA
eukprot:jgi/Psemu1/326831/estExt_fgenesh1_pg.C_4770015